MLKKKIASPRSPLGGGTWEARTMVSVLTRVEDYLHSEIKRGMIKERRERGPTAPGGVWEPGGGGGGERGVAHGEGGSLREQWRNNVQIAVSDAPCDSGVSLCGHHAFTCIDSAPTHSNVRLINSYIYLYKMQGVNLNVSHT